MTRETSSALLSNCIRKPIAFSEIIELMIGKTIPEGTLFATPTVYGGADLTVYRLDSAHSADGCYNSCLISVDSNKSLAVTYQNITDKWYVVYPNGEDYPEIISS